MCTASWWFGDDGGYDLFFNRDEQKSRPVADAPKTFNGDGTSFLAPTDTARGGSWIATNEFGVTVCLLNHHPEHVRNSESIQDDAPSRGQLVLLTAGAATVREAMECVASAELSRFKPFHLLALAPNRSIGLMTWDGRHLAQAAVGVTAPITTSSYHSNAVIAERRRQFSLLMSEVQVASRPPLEAFQDQHDPVHSAYSVLMNRPDASTVSQTHVQVTPVRAQMSYQRINWIGGFSRGPVSDLQLQLRPMPALAL
jgi:hypothetical protein